MYIFNRNTKLQQTQTNIHIPVRQAYAQKTPTQAHDLDKDTVEVIKTYNILTLGTKKGKQNYTLIGSKDNKDKIT